MSKKKKNRSWIQEQRDADRHYSEWFKRVHGSAYEGSPEEREDLEEFQSLGCDVQLEGEYPHWDVERVDNNLNLEVI